MRYMQKGYSTTTYKCKLDTKKADWMIKTKQLYNSIIEFYYYIIINNPEVIKLNTQKLLLQLEIWTISSSEKKEVPFPIPFLNVAAYFRRSAINNSISMARCYFSNVKTWEEKKKKLEDLGKIFTVSKPKVAQVFSVNPVYYKGLYKGFNKNEIILKLWTGKSWAWVKYKFKGRIPEYNSVLLSPTIVINNKGITSLHIPVKAVVDDIRTAKQRFKEKERYCSVIITGSENLAVCSVFESDGTHIKSHFIKGGNELNHRRKCLLGIIYKNLNLSETIKQKYGSNKKHWKKIRDLIDYHSHRVSRRIVDFCISNNVKTIVFPDYSSLDIKNKKFLEWDNSKWLGKRIFNYVSYKSWKDGIIVSKVSPIGITWKCNHCSCKIKKYNYNWSPSDSCYGGKNFICENGHTGNSAFNTTIIIGQKYLNKLSKT